MNKKKTSTGLFWLAILALILIFVLVNPFQTKEPDVLTFAEFKEKAQAEEILAVHSIMGTNSYSGLYAGSKNDPKKLPKGADFTMEMSEEQFTEDMKVILAEKLGKPKEAITAADFNAVFGYNTVRQQDNSLIVDIITYVFMFGMLLVVVFVIMRQQGGGKQMTNFGKSRARLQGTGGQRTTFADVAGADEEKAEMQEIVEFMREPERFNKLGARIPKGVLLVGPPGTGKTLLAKAVAGEAKVPFFSISGSDFVEMFVGVGASRVRDLFQTAKNSAPAVVFIDEIDAVGRQRGAGLGGGHDEREQTLNQLLVEMDGFEPNQGIIVLAATNRSDILDPALLRPGRFDRQITVNYPDVRGREDILKVHAKNKILGADVDLSVVAKRTVYFTGADLENLLNEAAILAARNKRDSIAMADMEEAATRVQMGPEKRSRVVTEEDKRCTAYHEAGHALAAIKLEKCDPLHEVSIISRGRAAGYTMMLPKDDWMHMTQNRMLDTISMSLAGRVAEKLKFGDVSTGAVQDLKQSTEMARKMVEHYGMSEEIGPVFLGNDTEVFIAKDWGHSKNYSERVAALVDAEIRSILTTQFERAEEILKANLDALDATATALLKYERMSGEEFFAIANGSDPEEVMKAGAKAEASTK